MNLIRAFSYNEQVRRQSVEHVCSFTHNISSHFKSDVLLAHKQRDVNHLG